MSVFIISDVLASPDCKTWQKTSLNVKQLHITWVQGRSQINLFSISDAQPSAWQKRALFSRCIGSEYHSTVSKGTKYVFEVGRGFFLKENHALNSLLCSTRTVQLHWGFCFIFVVSLLSVNLEFSDVKMHQTPSKNRQENKEIVQISFKR